MKKRYSLLLLIVVIGLLVSACSNKTNNNTDSDTAGKQPTYESSLSAKEMTDKLLAQVEQPQLMDIDAASVKDQFHLDASLLADYSIKMPLMNVKSNEIAILKINDIKDIPAVETALKQRAADVQKQFETYLPDQYENAQNFKIIVKGVYVLYVISESADQLAAAFDELFAQS
ncbi:DUF4358 domain-containing protein [Cohnella faecalis]|uniref:DUF4358 domain-containing protein n=1 Tax=Cohnella faecalis TaxID=2315694 RepID=A0A398CTY3_9BACL|nr:DUF4358 domain-containing protein [Cohnella faecalis]RIE04729.1 DUF4358 domain-containing protein [Cohnella faecalis]